MYTVAYVECKCDCCKEKTIIIELTGLGEVWDDSDEIAALLHQSKWQHSPADGKHVCPECQTPETIARRAQIVKETVKELEKAGKISQAEMRKMEFTI